MPESLADRTLGGRRFHLTLFSTFAAVAAALVLIGIYGVPSYLVSQMATEVGCGSPSVRRRERSSGRCSGPGCGRRSSASGSAQSSRCGAPVCFARRAEGHLILPLSTSFMNVTRPFT